MSTLLGETVEFSGRSYNLGNNSYGSIFSIIFFFFGQTILLDPDCVESSDLLFTRVKFLGTCHRDLKFYGIT